MENLNNLPFTEYKDRIFERLEKMTEYTSLTAEEQAQYDADVKFAMDYEETMLYRYDEGLERGLAEGRAEGRAEGQISQAWKSAEKMFAKGLDLETISEFTGLSLSQLEERFFS